MIDEIMPLRRTVTNVTDVLGSSREILGTIGLPSNWNPKWCLLLGLELLVKVSRWEWSFLTTTPGGTAP
jgi:hypothetical protein